MNNNDKTKKQLIEEIGDLRQKIIELQEEKTAHPKVIKESAQRKHFIESLINLSPDIIYLYDLVTKKNVYSNDGVQYVLGYSVEDIQNMGHKLISILMHPDDMKVYLEETLPRYAEAQGSERISHQYRMQHNNGNWIHIDCTETTYKRQADGSPHQILGVMHDITERKMMTEKIERSEEQYRTLLNNIPQKIFYKDIDLVYLLCNESYAEDLNIKASEIIGKTDYDFFNKKLAKKYRANDREVINSGCMTDMEEKYVVDGKEMTVHTIKAPILDETGKITGVFGVFWDITERKEILEVLRQSEEKFKSIADNAADCIFIKDIGRRYTFVNPAMQKLLNLPENEILGKTPGEIFGLEQEEIIKEVDDLSFSGETVNETRALSIGDKKYFFNTIQSPVNIENGKVSSIMGIVRDITSQHQAEDGLQKAHDELELHVRERTVELKEKNVALKVLLKQREQDKTELEQNILSNINSLIQPYITKLKRNNSNSEDISYLNIIESNLEDIVSPFSRRLSASYIQLSAKEIRIANLIKGGKKDKEIMEIMNIAFDTVKSHRRNIRKKLGIHGNGTNLRNKLLSL